VATSNKKVFRRRKNRILPLRCSFQIQTPKLCTDLDLSLFYILIMGTYHKFARKNNFLALGVCHPQPSGCSSAGCRFATSRSRLQNYRRIVSFPQKKIDEMRCKLDSTENPRSFEKYPTPPVGLGISRTNVDSQWNLVYNAFHWILCSGNETIRR